MKLYSAAAIAAIAASINACTVTREADLDGRNATNKPGIVVIDPAAPHRAAVWAQEAWESQQKLNPARWGQIRDRIGPRRRFEMQGHETEVQAAVLIYGVDEAAYRAKEAAAMRRGYDGMFANMTVTEIQEGMKRYSDEARRWVVSHKDEIEDQV